MTPGTIKFSPARQENLQRDNAFGIDASSRKDAPVTGKTGEESSVKVMLSDYTRQRMDSLRNLSRSMQPVNNRALEARKNAARTRAAQLKQQIETLKKIAMSLGPMAAKSLLRQIKQIAREIRQIAGELAQSPMQTSNGNPGEALSAALSSGAQAGANRADGEAVTADTGTASLESAIAQAEKTASPPPEEGIKDETGEAQPEASEQTAQTVGAAADEAERDVAAAEDEESEAREGQPTAAPTPEAAEQRRAEAQQKRQDAAMVRELAEELRKLLALVKAQLLRQDRETKKDIKETEKLLKETEELANMLENAADAGDGAALPDAAVAATDITAVEAVTAAVGGNSVNVSLPSISVFV